MRRKLMAQLRRLLAMYDRATTESEQDYIRERLENLAVRMLKHGIRC